MNDYDIIDSIGDNDVEKVEKYIREGGDVNFYSEYSEDSRYYLLHEAVSSSHTTMVDLFLKNGADVSVKTDEGLTCLDIVLGYVGISRDFQKKYTKLLYKMGAHPSTIHFAALGGFFNEVEGFLDAGANVNEKANNGDLGNWQHVFTQVVNGNTPLHMALCNGIKSDGHRKVVELLLDYNTDTNAANENGVTAFHLAVIHGNLKLADLFIKKGANVNQLFEGDVMRETFYVGDENALAEYGENILHVAASKGLEEVVEWLITKGADLDVLNNRGQNALTKAFFNFSDEVEYGTVELLLDAGIDLNSTKGNYGDPILHELNDSEAIKILIAHGIDLESTNSRGKTALHAINDYSYCNENKLFRKAKILIENGANVNAIDDNDYTPLDSSQKHKRIADLLRKHGGKTGEELKAEGK